MADGGLTPEQYEMLYGAPQPADQSSPAPPPPPPPPKPSSSAVVSEFHTPDQLPVSVAPIAPSAALQSPAPPPPVLSPPPTSQGGIPGFVDAQPPSDAPEGLASERNRWLAFARDEYQQIVAAIDADRAQRYVAVTELQNQIEDLQATSELQDLGLIFSGEHPTAKSVDYKDVIDQAKGRRKMLAKTKNAVLGNQSWAIGGDITEGRKLVDEISKLMLRAYNNELDALIKATNATNGDSKVSLLGKKRDQIKKLGSRMGLEISPEYHELAVYELRQVGRFQAAKLVEKEQERAHKEQLREEKRVAEEIAKEQAKLDTELHKYEDAMARLVARPGASPDEIAELQTKLEEVQAAKSDVNRRAANTRAGHVYVISNPGTMGDAMIKIGMTRRLNPQDRVDELGDASVPFRFGVHALIFSDDAVGLEKSLHDKFADRRVNKVNMRREFFYATPEEVKEALVGLSAHMLEFDEHPSNEEWEASR